MIRNGTRLCWTKTNGSGGVCTPQSPGYTTTISTSNQMPPGITSDTAFYESFCDHLETVSYGYDGNMWAANTIPPSDRGVICYMEASWEYQSWDNNSLFGHTFPYPVKLKYNIIYTTAVDTNYRYTLEPVKVSQALKGAFGNKYVIMPWQIP
jgi:hypothetical protein